MSAICSSLSSASPAHTPKEEYAITQPASAPKEETLHDQPEHQGERRDDRSGMTEGKSLTGRAAARHLWLSVKGCVEKEFPLIFCHFPPHHRFPLSEEVPLCGLCPSLGLEGPEEEKSWEEHQEQLEKEMQEARRMVFHLQVSVNTNRVGWSLRTPACK